MSALLVTNRILRLGVVVWSLTARVALAQASTMDCRPGDSTVVCCIKKHPRDPAGACGATPSEVEQVLRAVRSDADADDDDYSNNASLPEWKQACIRQYNRCQDRKWMGNCNDCLRRCEGQQEWLSLIHI